jgi:hypothetical protein
VHVYCALWHAEIKFSNATRLDIVEGIGAPTLRYDAVCKLCKTTNGACVSCLQCHANFHVGCAHSSGYTFGLDMTPVKVSRRDAVPTVNMNGETGTLIAAVWCKEHAPKTVVHPMTEEVEGTELVALQLFAREFKQADLTLTGTARKANLVDQSTQVVPQPAPVQVNRRASAITASTPTSTRGRQSNAGIPVKEEPSVSPAPKTERKCVRCKTEISPRWWKINEATSASIPATEVPHVVDGPLSMNGSAELNGHVEKKPLLEEGQIVNGNEDQPMSDVPSAVSQSQLRLDTDVEAVHSTSYHCQKCHWKAQNGINDEEERAKSVSMFQEPQQLPVRSPLPPFVPPPPPALAGSWAIPGGPPHLPANQPPPLPAWHSSAPPSGPHPLPHHLHNGSGYVPQGPHVGHAPPYHAPYPPQPNGYPAYSAPQMHPSIVAAGLRPPYSGPPISVPPGPHHLNNNAMLANGMQSPRMMPYSPTHPHAHPSSRSTESPFTAPPPSVQQYAPLHHSSPAPGRPETPMDTVMRDAPPVTSAPTERANTGASASPSLRNLLH